MQFGKRALTRRELFLLAAVLLILFLVIQVFPIGAERSNPPVVAEPSWDSPRTRELFHRACADCHSNETRWPWYSHVAPVSWLVAHDVAEGREHFNTSEWNRPQRHAGKAARELREGDMPLPIYLPMHREARLSPGEKQELLAGLIATFGESRQRDGEPDDD